MNPVWKPDGSSHAESGGDVDWRLQVEPVGDAWMRECREYSCTPLVQPCFALPVSLQTHPAIDPPLQLFQGTYVLRAVSEQPVPVAQVIGEMRTTRLADTLYADGRGHYTESIVTEVDSLGGAYRLTTVTRPAGEYEVRNDTVRFVVNCPIGYFCAYPKGWFEDGWFLTLPSPATAPVSRFERVLSDR